MTGKNSADDDVSLKKQKKPQLKIKDKYWKKNSIKLHAVTLPLIKPAYMDATLFSNVCMFHLTIKNILKIFYNECEVHNEFRRLHFT